MRALVLLLLCACGPVLAAVGFVDAPAAHAITGPRLEVRGWAHAPDGIRAVEIRSGGRRWRARSDIERRDVAAARPDLKGAIPAGFEFRHDFSDTPAPPGWDRREVAIVAIARDGSEAVLARKWLVEPASRTRWQRFAARAKAAPFYLLPALSGVGDGGAVELDGYYRELASDGLRIGMRVPILYLRTTRGAGEDFAFDPAFDTARRCGARRIADDNLATVLGHAEARRLPVLVTLNGGIWADAACDAPEWDVNDHLERDPANCQWNERDQVRPDGFLADLPGSSASPELARALTLNVYAAEVRRYKRRNLQQAGRAIAAFARRHPRLFVGVNLDPDVYVNPFFLGTEWYDYNPGTLRQFRHWLAGTGPYAGEGGAGVPDLRAWRRAKPLTLAEVAAISGKRTSRWEDVDPPRAFPWKGVAKPFWADDWVREWEHFRRHLVHLHYSELAQWLAEAGVPRDRIWSSQGFTGPKPGFQPFALRLASPVKNYDSGGVSVEGSVPRGGGHLGAILYASAADNSAPMEGGGSVFAGFAAFDRDWAAVEFNTADLQEPRRRPTIEAAYRAFRDLWNHEARLVSPMAWNGWNGIHAGDPGYLPYTSWRNTPAEAVAQDFLLARQGLARGSRLYTFGTPDVASDDGWTAVAGTIAAQPASLRAVPGADGKVVLVSPPELRLARATRLVVLTAGASPLRAEAFGRASPTAPWKRLAAGDAARGIAIPAGIDQLRLSLTAAAGGLTITRIALLP